MQRMTPQQGRALAARQRITQINRALDTINENMFDLLQAVLERAEREGWSDKQVARGLKLIDEMKEEAQRLEAERRALYAATTAQAS